MNAVLRDVIPSDLDRFFDQQADPDAFRMADFPARDRAAFDEHWATKVFGVPGSIVKTILGREGEVAGHVCSWLQDGKRFVGYWLGKSHWGQGLASRALAELLLGIDHRPLYARLSAENIGSLRVLEKCGFKEHERKPEYSKIHQRDIEALTMRLG